MIPYSCAYIDLELMFVFLCVLVASNACKFTSSGAVTIRVTMDDDISTAASTSTSCIDDTPERVLQQALPSSECTSTSTTTSTSTSSSAPIIFSVPADASHSQFMDALSRTTTIPSTTSISTSPSISST